MTAVTDVLAAYERLQQRSTRMLAWAREEDWDHLLQEEAAYVVAVDNLKRLEADCELDHAALQQKANLLERILEQDAEVRQRLETRRDQLSELIGDTRRRHNVARAYQSGDSVPAMPVSKGLR